MGRALTLKYGQEVSAFDLERVTREKVHGRRRRAVVDERGEACAQALLLSPGAVLLPPGGTTSVYVDEDFNALERAELVAVDADGAALAEVESSLGRELDLSAPVPVERLLDCAATAVYALSAEAIGPELAAALDRGEIFEVPFAWRKSPTSRPLFILAGAGGVLGILGEPTGFEYCEREPRLDDEMTATDGDMTDIDDLLDALDFGMF